MDDLIISVNIDETNQHHNLIIDTFLGTMKTFKDQHYSGQLRKVNVFSLTDADVSQKNYGELLTVLRRNENRQLAPYRHMIYEQNVIKIFSAVNEFTIYYHSQKSGMYRVLSFFEKPVDFIIERSQSDKKFAAHIDIQQKKESVSKEARLIALSKQIFLFDHNTVYPIRKIVDSTSLRLYVESINSIIRHAWKPPESQAKRYALPLEHKPAAPLSAEKTVNSRPVPVLYLQFDKKGLITANLRFRYDTMEVDYNSPDECVIFDHQKFYRDKKIEFDYVNILTQYNWKKSLKNTFIYQGQFIVEDINSLLEKEFIILSEKGAKVLANSVYSHHMNYGIDWFYLNTNIHIGDKAYSLAKILNLKNKQQQWIEIDNHIVFLPKELIDHKHILSVNNDNIAISKKNIGDALELAEALAIKKIDNIERITDFNNIEINIPTELLARLRAYQIDGVKWLLYLYQNHFGGCLADDMGLGKTIQVIAFLSDRKIKKNNQLSLIIVPKTLLFNWKNELEKFNPELTIEIYHGNARMLDLRQKNNSDIILTTYGTVLHDIDKLSCLSYNCLIMDEAQYIKNNNAKTYRAVSLLSSQIKIALTGTPIENNIGELWSLMNLLNPKIWGKKKDFINQYSIPQAIERLKIKIGPFVLRRTKKQVLQDLPKKIESIIYCDMDEEQSSLYNALLLNIKQEMDKIPGRFEIKTNAYILRGLLHLRQVCCHPKLLDAQYNINHCRTSAKFEVLQGIVNQLYYEGEKVVIFSQFTTMLKIIEKWLKQEQYQYFYLDGQTNNREVVISEFEESANGVLLISLNAGGVGINLTSASYAVIYDPWWNPATENQAADRLYRIGQKRNVTIYKLITANSIEEKVDELKKIKLVLFDQVLVGQDMMEELTIEDMKRFLM